MKEAFLRTPTAAINFGIIQRHYLTGALILTNPAPSRATVADRINFLVNASQRYSLEGRILYLK